MLIDYERYEQEQETLALLKILALGQQQVREGYTQPMDEVFDELERRWGG